MIQFCESEGCQNTAQVFELIIYMGINLLFGWGCKAKLKRFSFKSANMHPNQFFTFLFVVKINPFWRKIPVPQPRPPSLQIRADEKTFNLSNYFNTFSGTNSKLLHTLSGTNSTYFSTFSGINLKLLQHIFWYKWDISSTPFLVQIQNFLNAFPGTNSKLLQHLFWYNIENSSRPLLVQTRNFLNTFSSTNSKLLQHLSYFKLEITSTPFLVQIRNLFCTNSK